MDDAPLKLILARMTTWSIVINNNLADIENAPSGLFEVLVTAKMGTLNPWRATATAYTYQKVHEN